MGLPRTSVFDVALAQNVERAHPAVFRKLYFLVSPGRKPVILAAFDQLVRFLGADGPPATAIMTLEREDAELVRVSLGYVHDIPPRVGKKNP